MVGVAAERIPPRYVVSIRMTGLGDRLICLAAAWLYARTTGRTLVVDWRFGYLSPNYQSNAFAACFRNRGQMAGVPIIGDDTVAQLEWPEPRYPAIFNSGLLLHRPTLRPASSIEAHREAAVELIQTRKDRPEPVIVFDACINDGIVRFEDAHEFFRALQPVDAVAEAVEAFRRQQFGGAALVGLHIRHGNGGDIMGHMRFWSSFDDAIARCLRCVAQAREKLGQNAPVFLCTDSVEVEEALTARVPNLITRPKQFRPPGQGELHLHSSAWQSRDDTLAEMLLLAHTQALIRYPPGSFFSLYAAVMKPRTGPPPATLYDLLSGAGEADPLSPALIL